MTRRPGPYREFVAARTFDVLGGLDAMAARRGTSMAGLALGWLLGQERVSQIVIGPGRPRHLTPVREALEHPVTDSERAEIEGIVG
jgi:L-glyceraldehyde 3-phosphate reductase